MRRSLASLLAPAERQTKLAHRMKTIVILVLQLSAHRPFAVDLRTITVSYHSRTSNCVIDVRRRALCAASGAASLCSAASPGVRQGLVLCLGGRVQSPGDEPSTSALHRSITTRRHASGKCPITRQHDGRAENTSCIFQPWPLPASTIQGLNSGPP